MKPQHIKTSGDTCHIKRPQKLFGALAIGRKSGADHDGLRMSHPNGLIRRRQYRSISLGISCYISPNHLPAKTVQVGFVEDLPIAHTARSDIGAIAIHHSSGKSCECLRQLVRLDPIRGMVEQYQNAQVSP